MAEVMDDTLTIPSLEPMKMVTKLNRQSLRALVVQCPSVCDMSTRDMERERVQEVKEDEVDKTERVCGVDGTGVALHLGIEGLLFVQRHAEIRGALLEMLPVTRTCWFVCWRVARNLFCHF